MPDVALKAGIAWKKALVQANLAYAKKTYPQDTQLAKRYSDELKTLDTPSRAAYDLVKRNLEYRIESEEADLAAWEGLLAHRGGGAAFENRETTHAYHVAIDSKKQLLDDLTKEGPPP